MACSGAERRRIRNITSTTTEAAKVTLGFIPAYVHGHEKCVVCGDKATGIHYHAMTCEGCKGFFRRAMQDIGRGKIRELTCKKENKCKITQLTRNGCQSCRFNKCLEMRMDPKLVKTERERKTLRRLIATNRTKKMKKNVNILNLMEWDVLYQIANNYKSLSTQTFFRFISKDEKPSPEQYSTNEMTSEISHAFNFVRSIPGINKIDPGDFLSLVKTHLIDVILLLMAEVFNRSENVLCFTNCNLHESFLEESHEEYRSIFKYAKYYSRFVTNDGMVLGCLAALRFLNTDGIVLKDPGNVDKTLENILHISKKFWNMSENKTLMRELLAGLPNFESIMIKDKEKSFIAFMNSNVDNFQSRLEVNQLFSHSGNSSPEYETRNTSTASSFISTGSSTYEILEEEDDSDSAKHETSGGRNFIFDKNVNSQSGDEYMDAQFQMLQIDSRKVARSLSDKSVTSALYDSIILNDHSKQDNRQRNSTRTFLTNNRKPAQPLSIPQDTRMIDNTVNGIALLTLANSRMKNGHEQDHSHLSPQPAHQQRPSSSFDDLIQPTVSMLRNINLNREMNSDSFQGPFLKDHQDQATDLSSGLRYSKISAVQIPYDNKMSAFVNPSHIPGPAFYNPTESLVPLTSFTEQYLGAKSSSTFPSNASSSVQVDSEVKFSSKLYNFETASLTKSNVPQTASLIKSNFPQTASLTKSNVPQTASLIKSNFPQTASLTKSNVPQTASLIKSNFPQTASLTKSNVPQTANSISNANETTDFTSCHLYTDNPKQSDEPQSSAHEVKLPSREPSGFCQKFPKIKKLWMHQFNDKMVSNN